MDRNGYTCPAYGNGHCRNTYCACAYLNIYTVYTTATSAVVYPHVERNAIADPYTVCLDGTHVLPGAHGQGQQRRYAECTLGHLCPRLAGPAAR